MTRFRVLLVALLTTVIWAVPLEAQQTGTIRGRIVDASLLVPVSGAAVMVDGRTVLSDEDGRFVLTVVPAGTYTLRVARLGYGEVEETVTVVSGETTNVEIEMLAEAVEIEPLVAIGYGERPVRDLTGVVQEVSLEEFNPGRIVSPEELIQGKVAGVQVAESNGGEPGGGISIRIRGGTSVNASNEPLFVVDGVPLAVGGGISAGRNPLNFLNAEDIESMTILKDASATAIYGSRGANGVVIIETKGAGRVVGGMGSRLTYTGTVSGSGVTAEPDVLTAQQFRDAVAEYNPSALDLLGNANTDWRDAVQRSGYGHEHTIAFAGATRDFDYRLSLGYLNQEGVIRGSATERATVGLRFRHRFFDERLSLSANVRGARINDDFTPGGVVGLSSIFAPTQPILDPDSPHGGYFEWYDYMEGANNPVAMLNLSVDEGTTLRSVGDIEARFEVPYVAGLRGNVRFGYDATKTERETFRPTYLRGEAERGYAGFVSRSNNTQSNVLFDVFANYDRSFESLGGTDLNLTAGYSYEESKSEYPYFEAQGLSFDYLGTSGVPAAQQQRSTIWLDESRLISFFGRANFTVADRYLLTLSVRRDGSSRFGADEQWGTFPSAAFAWRIINEPFLEDVGWLSDLKLRLTWGKNGNQAFENYQQYPTYDVGDDRVQYQFGDDFVTTIRPGAADRGIKWEETTSTDIGLDFGFSNNRFTGAIDYYFKKTKDLLFEVPVPAGTFTKNYIWTNIGSVENRGLELSLSALLFDGRDGGFSWNADFNAATNSNELTEINPWGGGEVILTGGIAGAVGNFIQVLQPGQPVNSFYVYRHIRDPETGKPIYDDVNDDGFIDGDELLLMYEDVNGDDVINQDDRVPFKSPAPTWIIGHTSRMTWGRFDASFTIRAYLGNHVYNNVASNYGHYRALSYVVAPNNLVTSVLDTGFESEQYFSDYYVEDASFLRMDNLTVGYTFSPFRSVQRMRVFGTVQNLFMLTGYDGVDPLAGVNGIDNNLYPRSRTFTAGVNVWF
jgi:TonB-linked SusC/RagA family outer membrane protein